MSHAMLLRLVAVVVIAGLPAAVLRPGPVAAAKTPSVPEVTARAVFSFDISAGVTLYAKNENEQLEPASTTKIATALLLVRNVEDLSQTVTIEPGDLNAEGESTMALQAGDVVTFQDLLYGLLLPSGNDAANAVARVIGGQLLQKEGGSGDATARFVQEMNALAAELKMANTVFKNPTGLHQSGHVTSAKDMALLARKAFTNRIIRDVIATPSYDVNYNNPNGHPPATITTTVKLKQDGVKGVVGGKTGTTPEAGACLVLETEASGGNRVITVLMGSAIQFDADGIQDASTDQRYNDMQAILDQMTRDYRWIDVARANAVPGLKDELTVWDVALADDDAIVVPNADADVTYLLQLGPEGKPEERVGTVLFFVDNDQVAERAVVQLAPGGETAALQTA